MAQIKTRKVGVLKYMQSKAFAEGFKEARAGKPFNYDRVALGDDFQYEAGRQFGMIYAGSLKNGNTIDRRAAYALSCALRDREVMA